MKSNRRIRRLFFLALTFTRIPLSAQEDTPPIAQPELEFAPANLIVLGTIFISVAILAHLLRRRWEWMPWWLLPLASGLLWWASLFFTQWLYVFLAGLGSTSVIVFAYACWTSSTGRHSVGRHAQAILITSILTATVGIGLACLGPNKKPTEVISLVSEPPVIAEKLGEQVLDSTLQSAESLELDIKDPALSIDSTPVDDPLAAPPMVEITAVLDANTAVSEMAAPSIGMALTGREKGAKRRLLAGYGGNATTEEAVLRGLQWLKQQQRSDGSWSMTGPYSQGSGRENVTAATAMALLAFQGAGHSHRDGDFKAVVAKGWDALLKMQNADGDFVREASLHQRLYAQAQATIAVCEIYGMTKDPKFKRPAQKAVDFAFKAQSPEGGWRYEPMIDADVSVTGWFVMALQSAMMAGLEVQSPSLDKISGFLDRCATEGGSRFRYQPGKNETAATTAAGLLCRQQLGWKQDDERLRRGVDYLRMNPITYNDENVYYWYYATQVLHHIGGKDWDQWNAVMRQAVPERQLKTGAEQGSWPPTSDRWGSHGGRLYTTCLSILILESYYRHLPLYKHKRR